MFSRSFLRRSSWVRKVLSFATMSSMVLSYAAGLFQSIPLAQAATFTVNASGLPNGAFPGAPVHAPSGSFGGSYERNGIIKLSVTADGLTTLNSVRVDFSGTGFSTGDLVAIDAATSSGVALYRDNGSSSGSFDFGDQVIELAGTPDWTGSTMVLTPASPVAVSTSPSTFFVAFRLSGAASEGDRIVATVPAAGVVLGDATTGPATPFVSNDYRVDVTPPTMLSCEGFIGSSSLTVRFNEPVQRPMTFMPPPGHPAGPLVADSFIYGGPGSDGQTITSVAHVMGQDFAVLTLSGPISANDLDGSPATCASALGEIADMAGNAMSMGSPLALSSPLGITTPSVPSATAGASYAPLSPLVTFSASGGTGVYAFSTADAGSASTLSGIGLSLAADGKLTGSVGAGVSGSFSFAVRVTDSGTASTTRSYTVNVGGSGGGGIPGISSVSPPGGAQGSAASIAVVGSNTSFGGSTTVDILSPPGFSGTHGITAGSPTVANATHLSVSVTVAPGATAGPRDVRITTGGQVVTLPGGFSVFAGGGSGLTLQLPADASTGVPIPPTFTFGQTSNSSAQTYVLQVKSSSDPSALAIWRYAFPKTTDPAVGHCTTSQCNVHYGDGRFRTVPPSGQPAFAPLAPNTTYYWQVLTYAASTGSVDPDGATPALETSSLQSFTTVSSLTDTVPPQIIHRPIFSARAGANLNVFARIFDNIATTSTSPALTVALLHCRGASCTPSSSVAGTTIGNGYYRFTIPTNEADGVSGSNGVTTRYLITASDGTNSASFPSDAATLVSASAGAATIGGTVLDSAGACSAGVQGASVFIDGTGLSATTDGSCAFTLASVPAGTYSLVAFKDGYGERRLDGIPTGASGLALRLGAAGAVGGIGGDTVRPRVRTTCPMDGSRGLPGNDSNFKICLVFDKSMSESTINASGALVVKDLTANTNITSRGSWTYYPSAPVVPGVPSEANMAVFTLSGSNTLGENKTIAVIVGSDVTDTAGNAVQGNQPDGSYAFSFTTGATFTGGGGAVFGSGSTGIPPRVVGSTPPPGGAGVPINTRLVVNFSDPMADDEIGTYVLRNFVKVFLASDSSETSLVSTATLDNTKRIATIVLSGSLTASTSYRLKVLGGAKGATGITLGPPGMGSSPVYMADFRTGSTSDTAAPTVVATFPADAATGVSVNVGTVSASFSSALDASTVTDSNIYLSIGSTVVNATLDYRPMERRVVIVPRAALTPLTTYTLTITTSVQGVNGVPLATTVTKTFTTGAAVTTAPEITMINPDDHAIAVTFSAPMLSASALDTINRPRSVTNPDVYDVIKYGTAGFNPGSTGTSVSLSGARFTWDALTNTVLIEGVDLSAARGQELFLSMDTSGPNQARDISGNDLSSTAALARATVRSSASTGGALVPGALSTSAFGTAGGFVPSSFSTSTYGFVRSFDMRPSVPMVSQSSKYFVRIPISRQIPAGGKIVFTFPAGFTLSGVKQDLASPSKTDWNGPAPGTITFACATNVAGGKSCAGGATVTGDDTPDATRAAVVDDGVLSDGARTVTVYLSAATNANDFLNIDLDGIVNAPTPLDFTTAGYTVTATTFDGSTSLETMTSQPFFLQSAGSASLSGTITMPANDQTCTINVYADSPITGHRQTTASFAGGATAAYSFTGLSDGDVMVSTDRSVTCGAGPGALDYVGKSMPDRVLVSGATTYNFTLPSAATGDVTVSFVITGSVGERLDVGIGSPSGFTVKQVTLATSPQTVTMKANNGLRGFMMVGPQVTPGSAPPTPTYVIPRPRNLEIDGGSCRIEGVSTCSASFELTAATKTIKGVVKDADGLLMSNTEVFAYAQGGAGTRAQTGVDGTFTLNVGEGSYIVGANFQGTQSRQVPVVVSSAPASYLFIDGASTGITPATASSAFVLKVAKQGCTISGKVTDGTNVIQNAGVFARPTVGFGGVNAMTDSSGAYTLYVACTGSYEVKAFAPGYGEMSAQTVAMGGSSQSSINFSPSLTGTFYTVSGRVYKDTNSSGTYNSGEEIQGAFVRIANGTSFNEVVSDSSGNYTARVSSGTGFTVKAFLPGIGDTPSSAPFAVNAGTGNVTGKDISIGGTNTITLISPVVIANGFVDAITTTGIGSHAQFSNSTSVTMTLPNGSYQIRLAVPGANLTASSLAGRAGTVYSSATGVLTVDGNETLDITLPTLRTVSGTVTDGSTGISGAWVQIVQPSTGVNLGMSTDGSGAYSLSVPDGSYTLNAMKAGYFGTPVDLTIAASTSVTLTLSQSSLSISGQVLVGSSGIANAYVHAEKQGGGFAGTQADAAGNYTLAVTAGTWRVFAVAQGYEEEALSTNPVTVSGSSLTGKNITLTTTVTLNPPGSQPIETDNGGTVEDQTAGVRLVIPANALSSDGSSAIVSYSETNNTPDAPGEHALPGFEFTAQTADGAALTNFNDSLTVQLDYTPAELGAQTAADGSAIDTLAEARNVQVGAYNPTTLTWDTSPTTMSCLAADGSNIVSPSSLSDCTEVRYSIVTDHFSLYAPIVATDVGAPDSPSGLAGSAGGTSSIGLSWTVTSGATSYDIYRSTSSGGTYARLGSEPTVSSGLTSTYTDSGLSSGTTYYYKITALNGSGESAASSAVSITTTSASSGSGGGGGGAASSLSTTQPSVTTPAPLPTSSSTLLPASPAPIVVPVPALTPVPAPVSVRTAAPASILRVFTSPTAVLGANLRFSYEYVNRTSKPQAVVIEREMRDAKGKLVKSSKANVKVLAGKTWRVDVNDTPAASWKKAGEYAITIRVKDQKTGKILEQVRDKAVITPRVPATKIVPATPPLPPATSVRGGVTFTGVADGATFARGGSLQFGYSYGNVTTKDQDVTITREFVDGKGATVQVARGSATVRAGTSWDVSIKDTVKKTLVPGSYSLIVTVKNKKTGQTLSENAAFVTVK